MVGIVVVSHSPRLAQAAVDLALEMVPGREPKIALAAGTGDGATGTDAVRVAAAIAEVSTPDGVLVLMDLGSAVLSAEMSLEFVADATVPVRLTSAPFVEGLLAAVVQAAGGATLDEVEREARGALFAKQSQLGEQPLSADSPRASGAVDPSTVSDELVLPNRDGLHARPAAILLGVLAGKAAVLTIANLRTGVPAVTITGPTSLLALGARQGDVLRITATGSDAGPVLAEVRQLVLTGFGESVAPPDAVGTSNAAVASPANPSAAARSTPLGVSAGRVVGPVLLMPAPITEPPPAKPLAAGKRAAEAARIGAAAEAVAQQLRARAARATGTAPQILEANALLAQDAALLDDARARVAGSGDGAGRAVWDAFGAAAASIAALGDRMAERAADYLDVRSRIVAELLGQAPPGVPESAQPFVLVARDLAPADMATLDPAGCLAVVTEEGGPTSHTAILARDLGIPAVVAAAGAWGSPQGTTLLVDGSLGELIWNPSDDVVAAIAVAATLAPFDGHGRTSDGVAVPLLANVGSAQDAELAATLGAEGVGLFRTEFCFLDREVAPTIAEQVEAYRGVLAAFPGRKVIVRTLDAGADKPLPFVTAAHEENPALGIRGYRTSWRRPEVLRDQLAAIAEAARLASAEVSVMAPMIATLDEAQSFVALCREYGLETAGVMIETPAAALRSPGLLSAVDFVSLGTNDLAQYTMAADRLVGELAALNDPWQPAVLQLVAAVGAAGRTSGTPVGICGEAASDPLLATVLVGAGATSLSMTPRALAAVAARLGRVTIEQCRQAAELAIAAPSASSSRAAVAALLGN